MVEIIPTEDQEQEMLFNWAAWHCKAIPELRNMYAIPNGGKREKAVAAKMQSTGTKPGVPDIFLAVAKGGYHGLYIELKRRKGGQLSQKQREWLERLTQAGYCAKVCKGYDEARKAILAYLGGLDE